MALCRCVLEKNGAECSGIDCGNESSSDAFASRLTPPLRDALRSTLDDVDVAEAASDCGAKHSREAIASGGAAAAFFYIWSDVTSLLIENRDSMKAN